MGKENVELLSELLAARGDLLKSLQGIRIDRAWTRPEPDEWSVVEVLQHVADLDGLQRRRLDEVRQGKADLSPHDAAEWERERSVAERDGLAGVFLRLSAMRLELLRAVSELTEADLKKTGRHAKHGPMTGLQLVEMLIRHDRAHAEQIAMARAVVEA